jgi:hypothetical protein
MVRVIEILNSYAFRSLAEGLESYGFKNSGKICMPGVHEGGDTPTFVKWLTSPEKGQKIIRDFGADKYGSTLFSPIPESGEKPVE